MTLQPMGVGFIGAGMISDTYLEHLAQFPEVTVVAIGDIDTDRAAAQATKHSVAFSGTPEEILTHEGVELVVNLTIPAVHAEVSLAAIEAGKHVWSEKPIATQYADAKRLLDRAAEKGLRVGIAPDTVLGQGVQSALRAIRAGEIGTPIAAHTAMMSMGPDKWHPNPDFFFQPGAGPVLDMGPYYLTTLVNVFGSVARVSAFGLSSTPTRRVVEGPRAGEEFPVQIPTHVNANIEFAAGGTSSSIFSWESPLPRMGVVEITGTEGTLAMPDPNRFEGTQRVYRVGAEEWEDLASEGTVGGRGLGVLDMVRGIRSGEPHRASGEIGLHVLEVMLAIEESTRTGQMIEIASRVDRPAAIPAGWTPYEGEGAVESRMTSSLGIRTCSAGASSSIIRSKRSTAARPMSVSGWRTVVRGGSVAIAEGMSSKPTTERSSGTRIPRACATARTSFAEMSFAAKIALGGWGMSKRRTAA